MTKQLDIFVDGGAADARGEFTPDSQNARLLAWFRQNPGAWITPGEAEHNLGIGRLASRIYDLEHARHVIERGSLRVVNARGKRVRVGRYRLA